MSGLRARVRPGAARWAPPWSHLKVPARPTIATVALQFRNDWKQPVLPSGRSPGRGLRVLARACPARTGALSHSDWLGAPTPDFEATLQDLVVEATASSVPATPPVTDAGGEPTGRIVYTCQTYKFQSAEQICLMNADGSDPRQLTQDASIRHYYPSMAPEGDSVVFSQYREDNVYEIYELSLGDGTPTRLTDRLGVLTGPEISPDGSLIAFMRWTPASNQYQIWLIDRDGGNPRRLFSGTGWDPTWSPDGKQVLFASDMGGSVQLYRVDLDGNNVEAISELPAIRGRSDWSPQGLITTYSGESWKREIYVMQCRRIANPAGIAHRRQQPGAKLLSRRAVDRLHSVLRSL